MRLLRRRLEVPVFAITRTGIRQERHRVTLWFCEDEDGTVTALAPWLLVSPDCCPRHAS